MRLPGLEPGSTAWKAAILPLDHRRIVGKGHFLLFNRTSPLQPLALLISGPHAAEHNTFFPICFFASAIHGQLPPAHPPPPRSTVRLPR